MEGRVWDSTLELREDLNEEVTFRKRPVRSKGEIKWFLGTSLPGRRVASAKALRGARARVTCVSPNKWAVSAARKQRIEGRGEEKGARQGGN